MSNDKFWKVMNFNKITNKTTRFYPILLLKKQENMTALKIVFLLAAPLKVKTRGGDKILLDLHH